MKNIRQEAVTWIQLVAFITTWLVLMLLVTRGFSINWETIKLLPEVVTIYTVLDIIFVKLAWRLPVFQSWLVPFPDLEGTWQGIFQTTWQNPKTGAMPPIPLVLVIKQSFETISCVIYTEESSSYSTAALISEEDDSGIKRLSYVYTNKPELTARNRSPVHDGAAILRIISTPERLLEGEYWTNRKTTGTISLKYRSKKRLEKFPDDLSPQSK